MHAKPANHLHRVLFGVQVLLMLTCVLGAADPVVLVGGYDPAVRAFTLSADGVLHPLATSTIGRNPSFLATSPDARMVYACEEISPGRVIACAFDRASGALRPLGSASSGGDGPCFLAVHPEGRWLFTANYGNGRVAALPVARDGGVGEPVSVIAAGANAHMALPGAGGAILYVPCKGTDRIVSCRFDAATGVITPVATAATRAGAGPRHLLCSADAAQAWLVDELASAIQPAVVAADGALTLGGQVSTLPPGWTGANTAGGIVSTDHGRRLLVSNRGHDSLAMFDVDAGGIPHPAGHVSVGKTPRHLAVSPDGRFVLVACQGADRIEVLRRDGDRWLPNGSATLPRPAFVGIIP